MAFPRDASRYLWRLAMKYLTALKELNAGEIISLAVLAIAALGIVYGVLS